MAASTRLRVSGLTLASPLMTRDTVIGETPACSATSCMVTALRPRLFDFFTSPSFDPVGMILEFARLQRHRLTRCAPGLMVALSDQLWGPNWCACRGGATGAD